LPRYRELTDAAVLGLRFPLAEAQEIIARENGYESWASLKAAISNEPDSDSPIRPPGKALLKAAIPIVFVSSVQLSTAFFRDKLGFRVDFLHGNPPFYGSVSRDGARLHLRFVHEPPFVDGVIQRERLICAFLEVEDIKSLYSEYVTGTMQKRIAPCFDQLLLLVDRDIREFGAVGIRSMFGQRESLSISRHCAAACFDNFAVLLQRKLYHVAVDSLQRDAISIDRIGLERVVLAIHLVTRGLVRFPAVGFNRLAIQ
jgi:hypothetical protein